MITSESQLHLAFRGALRGLSIGGKNYKSTAYVTGDDATSPKPPSHSRFFEVPDSITNPESLGDRQRTHVDAGEVVGFRADRSQRRVC